MKKLIWAIFALIVSLNATLAAGFDLAGKEEGIRLLSMPASTSPTVVASRVNAMIYLAGGTTPTNRSINTAAVYEIPPYGLEWFDVVQSGNFNFWLGNETVEGNQVGADQFGHNLVTSVSGRYPVSKYWIRILPNNPVLTGGFFQVGKNDAGKEIAFNQAFVGIAFGANGKLDSVINPNGVWEQRADDIIYSNGQLPSTVVYDVWYRFGSRTYIHVEDFSDMTGINSASHLWEEGYTVKAELIVRGEGDTVVASRTVTTDAAPIPAPTVTIKRNPTATGGVLVKVNGTPGVKYSLQVSLNLSSWSTVFTHLDSGSETGFTAGSPATSFYRAVQE